MAVEVAFVVEEQLGMATLVCSTYIVVEYIAGNGLWEDNTYSDSTSDSAAVILPGERGNRTHCRKLASLLYVVVSFDGVADRLELADYLYI